MADYECQKCGSKFHPDSANRQVGRTVGDQTTCPSCGHKDTTRSFMSINIEGDTGFGVQLSSGSQQPPLTPAQQWLSQMNLAATELDKCGLYKEADIVDHSMIKMSAKQH